jgi:hypothetical protein
MLQRIDKKTFLIWAAAIPLAICLIYSIFYSASNLGLSLMAFTNKAVVGQNSVLSAPVDAAVWGIAVFFVLAWLGYALESNLVRGYIRASLGAGLLGVICGVAVGACLVVFGFVGLVGLVPISILLLSLCVVFSADFFDVDRVPFALKLLIGGVVVGLVIELAGFLV